MVAEVAHAMRPRYTTNYRSATIMLDLDETERFEVPVQRHHRPKRTVRVSGIHIAWSTYTDNDGEQGSHALWALVGNHLSPDGEPGPEVRVPGAYLDPAPQVVTQAIADLAPGWFE